jgi:hypothetical protein
VAQFDGLTPAGATRRWWTSRTACAPGVDSSRAFRETLRRAPTLDPALLVIQFRLSALGSNRWAHAAFRRECVLHTPLFAGFPGFRSKLWADDVTTGVYRGIYEWDGAEAARAYATRMVGLLAPFSNADTARFQVVGGLRRDTFLRDPQAAPSDGADGWWRIDQAVDQSPPLDQEHEPVLPEGSRATGARRGSYSA